MTPDDTAATGVDVDEARIDRAAEKLSVDPEAVADALTVVHADLISRHSEFEEHPYVTVDGTRAYRLPEARVDDLVGSFDLSEDVAAAVTFAHTEQAQLLFAESVSGDDAFGPDERGLVVGVDTAEQF